MPMKSFISEDDIEQAICNRLSQPEYGWTRIECDPSVEKQDDVGETGRSSVKECILPEVFRKALKRINPQVDSAIIDRIVSDYRRDFGGTDMVDTNYKLYNQLRNGIKVDTRTAKGDDFEIVKLIDYDNIGNNDFHCVNQMWIKGHYRYRRPDVLLFVNGLPVVFIELKNSTVKVEEAYNKNLVSYREDIPNIFALNQICVLSNGLQTKLGAWTSKNLYQKLLAQKDEVMVVDWYKDDQPRQKVYSLIQMSLNEDLPESYDRVAFTDKTNLLLNHFIDMAVQGYG